MSIIFKTRTETPSQDEIRYLDDSAKSEEKEAFISESESLNNSTTMNEMTR